MTWFCPIVHSTHVLQLSLMTQLAHTPQAILLFVADEAVIRRELWADDDDDEVGVEMTEKELEEVFAEGLDGEAAAKEEAALEEEETEAGLFVVRDAVFGRAWLSSSSSSSSKSESSSSSSSSSSSEEESSRVVADEMALAANNAD